MPALQMFEITRTTTVSEMNYDNGRDLFVLASGVIRLSFSSVRVVCTTLSSYPSNLRMRSSRHGSQPERSVTSNARRNVKEGMVIEGVMEWEVNGSGDKTLP